MFNNQKEKNSAVKKKNKGKLVSPIISVTF